MYKRLFENFFSYLIYSLAILLAFLLVFESYLEFPLLVKWLGRMHPLILHFPIVMVLVTMIQYWRKDPDAFLYLTVTTVFALISAITGFVLSMDGGSKGDLLQIHQWLAVAVCLILLLWYYWKPPITTIGAKVLQVFLILTILGTGHYGGMVTHGRDFLAVRSEKGAEGAMLPDDPDIYIDIVQPILDRKCVACHNENKAKGELRMTNHADLLQGGKNGSALDKSKGIFHRISLPIDDEDHMPPPDEQQLAKDEILILEEWLELNAPADLNYSELQDDSQIRALVSNMIQKQNENLWSDLPDISDGKMEEIASEYCTIKRIYGASQALQVIVFPHKAFTSSEIQKLGALAKNTVELKLSNLPLETKDFETLSSFENLEYLDLSGSQMDGQDLKLLEKLNKLKTLKLYGTDIGDESIAVLSKLPALLSLYVYQTKISGAGVEELTQINSSLDVIEIEPKALEFKSVLPSPAPDPNRFFFNQPFYLKLNHPLDEIDIRYTVDGTEPGDNSPIFQDSLFVDQEMTVNYFASKAGWEASSVGNIQLLQSDYAPVSFELQNPPDSKYTGIGKSLLVDLEKGPENFGAISWMAFKDQAFSLTCDFEKEIAINKVVLSSMVHTDPYIFPPSAIKIYGGTAPGKMMLIGSLNPTKLSERQDRHFEFYQVELSVEPIRYLRVHVTPLIRIPSWHQGKGQKGWFFIDEVVFIAD